MLKNIFRKQLRSSASIFIVTLFAFVSIIFGTLSNGYGSLLYGAHLFQETGDSLTEASESILMTRTGSTGDILTYTPLSAKTVRGVDVRFENLIRAKDDINYEIRYKQTVIAKTIVGYHDNHNAEKGLIDVKQHNWTAMNVALTANDLYLLSSCRGRRRSERL